MKIRDFNRIALSVAFLAVCSWITVPGTVPFTMQSFAVFVMSALLGGKSSFYALLTYILLGGMGIPVFSGMRGGIGILLGETGGYLLGFLVGAPICGSICCKFKNIGARFAAMLLCLVFCYVFGCIWIWVLYFSNNELYSITALLSGFVLPYVIPDVIKIVLSILTVSALEKLKVLQV